MVNWTELNKLRDEIDTLQADDLLTYDEFQRRFELAQGYCKDGPRALEAFVRRAPTQWIVKHLAEPIAALSASESSHEPKLVSLTRTRSNRITSRVSHTRTNYQVVPKVAAKPQTEKIGRDAVTGSFVQVKKAIKHPKTSVVETTKKK